MARPVAKKLILAALLLLPVSMYLGSLVISGAVNFRTLEVLGPGPSAPGQDLSGFSLTQSNGSPWTADSMQGRIAVVSFFFLELSDRLPGDELSPQAGPRPHVRI